MFWRTLNCWKCFFFLIYSAKIQIYSAQTTNLNFILFLNKKKKKNQKVSFKVLYFILDLCTSYDIAMFTRSYDIAMLTPQFKTGCIRIFCSPTPSDWGFCKHLYSIFSMHHLWHSLSSMPSLLTIFPSIFSRNLSWHVFFNSFTNLFPKEKWCDWFQNLMLF